MRKPILLLWIALGTCPGAASSQASPCDRLNRLVESTYNFKPSKVSTAQREAKAREMDEVWSAVKDPASSPFPCSPAPCALH